MDRINPVIKKALLKVTPSRQEQLKINSIRDRIMAATEGVVKPLGLSYVMAGSFVRNTWLPNRKEFDVFILFPVSFSREKLEKQGIEIGKKIVKKLRGNYRIAYAEHPYVRAKFGVYEADFVPCYRVKSASKIKSAVDRTPFHSRWLAKNMQPGLAPQVRLLKQFAKSQGFYGSNTRVEGMSGYLCELLTVWYGSFKGFVKAAARWEPGQVFLDFKQKGKSPKLPVQKFKGQPLIVIDPVDPNRNVAAVLSPENFMRLVYSCGEFLEKPSVKFFSRPSVRVGAGKLGKLLKNRQTRVLGVLFKKPDVIDDILYPQLRRTAKRLRDILEEYEFTVLGWDVFSDEKDCVIFLEAQVWKLPAVRKLIGPSIFTKQRSEQFIKKYKNHGRLWVERSCWVTEIKRKFPDAEGKLKDSLSDPLKELKAKGIASYIAKNINRNFRLLGNKDVINLARKKTEFAQFLDNYFTKRII